MLKIKSKLLFLLINFFTILICQCTFTNFEEDAESENKMYVKAGLCIINAINDGTNNTFINFSESSKKNIEKIGFVNFIDQHRKNIGKIHSWDNPVFLRGVAKFQVSTDKGKRSMIVKLSGNGSVSSFKFLPPDPDIVVPERNTKQMSLPFKEKWHVMQGGDIIEQNYHMGLSKESRYAIDFVLNDSTSGLSHKSDGSSLNDYYGYDKDVLSVCEGVVSVVIDGVPDNRPFSINTSVNTGNYVIIKHDDYMFSIYCHLKLGSVPVKVGQKVNARQIIGHCGNSGNSGTPHLHFQISNSHIIPDSTGIKPYFNDINVFNGNKINSFKDYSPIKGDIIQNN